MRSLYNKLGSIRNEILDVQPDIVYINETWLNRNILDQEITIDGYTLLRNDRNNNQDGTIKRGGGICTYVKESIVFHEMNDLACFTVDIEISVIKLKLPFTRNIFIFNVYRPPAAGIDSFLTKLRDNRNFDLFIGGDYNINFFKKNSLEMKKFLKFCTINQLRLLINSITRPDSNACIDLILTNCDIVKENGILNINISDHLPILIIPKKIKTLKPKVTF